MRTIVCLVFITVTTFARGESLTKVLVSEVVNSQENLTSDLEPDPVLHPGTYWAEHSYFSDQTFELKPWANVMTISGNLNYAGYAIPVSAVAVVKDPTKPNIFTAEGEMTLDYSGTVCKPKVTFEIYNYSTGIYLSEYAPQEVPSGIVNGRCPTDMQLNYGTTRHPDMYVKVGK